MRQKKWIVVAVAIAGLFLGVVQPIGLPPMVANAAEVCGGEPLGQDLPVVTVPGLAGKRDAFGGKDDITTLMGGVEALKGVKTYPFAYEENNLRWVDHPAIGLALANQINCLAFESRKAGGPGKVVVIAHSMGGLATRWAAANGAGPNIGLLVTIGTPNTGSGVANVVHGSARELCEFYLKTPGIFYIPPTLDRVACEALLNQVSALDAIQGLQRYSRELAALPWMPSSTRVVAIAGNVRPKYMTFGFVTVEGKPFDSDLVVSKESALSRNNEGWDIGCASWLPIPEVGDADCDHTKLLRNEAVKIRVKTAITEYQKTLQPKPSPSPSSAKPTGVSCPSAAEFSKLTSQVKDPSMPNDPGATYVVQGAVTCDGNWAVASEIVKFPSGGESNALVVFQHDGKTWVFNTVGTDFAVDDPICQQATPKVKARLGC